MSPPSEFQREPGNYRSNDLFQHHRNFKGNLRTIDQMICEFCDRSTSDEARVEEFINYKMTDSLYPTTYCLVAIGKQHHRDYVRFDEK
jgi:hypothetical protein